MSRHIEEIERLAREVARPIRFGNGKLEPIAKDFYKKCARVHIDWFNGVLKILNLPQPKVVKSLENSIEWSTDGFTDEDYKEVLHSVKCGPNCKHGVVIEKGFAEDIALNSEFQMRFGPGIDAELDKLTQGIIDLLVTRDFDPRKEIFTGGTFDTIIGAGDVSVAELAAQYKRQSAAWKRMNPKSLPTRFVLDPNKQWVQNLYEQGYGLVRGKYFPGVSKTGTPFLSAVKKIMLNSLKKDPPLTAQQTSSLLMRRAGTGALWQWNTLVRTEMSSAIDRTSKETYEEEGVRYVKYSAAPGACDVCRGFASSNNGYYAIEDAPRVTADTHPNCRCLSIPQWNLPKGVTV